MNYKSNKRAIRRYVNGSGVEDLYPLTINASTTLSMTEKEAEPTFGTA